MNAGVINFAVYENSKEYLGTAKITLPDVSNKKFTVNGAGVAGDLDVPVLGHVDAMTVKIEFIDAPAAVYKLAEQRVHTLDCRVAHEEFDSVTGKLKVVAYKHVLEVMPLKSTLGTVAPSTSQGASNEYSCLSRKDFVDGKLMLHIDPARNIFIDSSGVNRLALVNAALGKK